MTELCGQLKAVSLRISSLSSLEELSKAMEQAGKAISSVSGNQDTQQFLDMIETVYREEFKLECKQEMMIDILEGMTGRMDDSIEEQKIYEQVLMEIGLEIKDEFVDAGTSKFIIAKKEEKNDEDSLYAMLKVLQKN
jgi:hypothetical protein